MGTGLKSTGCSFWRESVPTSPVLVYTNFLTDPANQVYSIEASNGVSLYPLDGGDLETLIHNSDSAMYEVKNNGGIGWSFYNAALCHETKKSKGNHEFLDRHNATCILRESKTIDQVLTS